MNQKTFSVIALSSRPFPTFAAKLDEAVHWLEIAAAQGTQLAVLPEVLNLYTGDGPTNTKTAREIALKNWQTETKPLFDAAKRLKLAVVIPVTTYDNDTLINAWFLISDRGEILGRYQKMFPTAGELKGGIQPAGNQPLIQWQGLKLGGAICFDTCFPQVFQSQAAAGADLFIIPALWPGGSQLFHFARTLETPMLLAYPGWSRIIDAAGREVAAGGYRHETLRFGHGTPVFTATLNFDRATLYGDHNDEHIEKVQQTLGSKIHIQFDQENCCFYLESRSPDLTVDQIIDRFHLSRAKDFFPQCLQKRNAALNP